MLGVAPLDKEVVLPREGLDPDDLLAVETAAGQLVQSGKGHPFGSVIEGPKHRLHRIEVKRIEPVIIDPDPEHQNKELINRFTGFPFDVIHVNIRIVVEVGFHQGDPSHQQVRKVCPVHERGFPLVGECNEFNPGFE